MTQPDAEMLKVARETIRSGFGYFNHEGVVDWSDVVESCIRAEIDPDRLLRYAAAALTATKEDGRIAGLEQAAKIADDADKSTHPASLADAIRALKSGAPDAER